MNKKVLGLVLEINPFHTGHKYFIDKAIEEIKPDVIIAIISTSFSMRGDPSIMDKFNKTKLLLENKIDIVLELPFIASNASADYFALNSIRSLSKFNITDFACGVELDNYQKLLELTNITSQDSFNKLVKKYLDEGLSYSTSNNKALLEYTNDLELVESFSMPNNTLAISYLKSFKKLGINPNITLIKRIDNNYYDSRINDSLSSATSIRQELEKNKENAKKFLVDKDYNYPNSTELLNKIFLLLKERFIVFGEKYFENILGVSEGIQNRIGNVIKKSHNYQELIDNSITKRYPEARIKRVLLNILFDVKKDDFNNNDIDYLRVLGFNDNGNNYIKTLNKETKKEIITTIKNSNNLVSLLECKVTEIYGLLINNNDFIQNEYLIPIKKIEVKHEA